MCIDKEKEKNLINRYTFPPYDVKFKANLILLSPSRGMDKSLRSDNIRGSWSFMVFHFTEGLVNEEDVAILAQNITKIFFN